MTTTPPKPRLAHALVLALAPTPPPTPAPAPPPTPVPSHPDSLSSSILTVADTTILLRQRLQIASLREILPDLDANADGFVAQSELDAARDDIFGYHSAHYRLWADARPTAAPLAGTLEDLRLATPDPANAPTLELVDLVARYSAPAPIRELELEMRLFLETSPGHREFATLVWNGEPRGTVMLDGTASRWRWRPSGHGVWRDFFRAGVEHILGGWDHLAFLAALLLATRRLRALLGVVTAFTVAHSATLALSVAGWVDLSAHSRFVESAIALSIAYVAADALLAPRRTRSHWIEAFVFGLVHGLGFAGFLAESLVMETARAAALVAFNLGVECGQLAVVALAAACLIGAQRLRRARQAQEFLAPAPLRLAGSVALVVLGLVVFAERAFA